MTLADLIRNTPHVCAMMFQITVSSDMEYFNAVYNKTL